MIAAVLAAGALAAASSSTPADLGPEPAPAPILDARMATLLDWFEGRFDNDAQVFFADQLGVPENARH